MNPFERMIISQKTRADWKCNFWRYYMYFYKSPFRWQFLLPDANDIKSWQQKIWKFKNYFLWSRASWTAIQDETKTLSNKPKEKFGENELQMRQFWLSMSVNVNPFERIILSLKMQLDRNALSKNLQLPLQFLLTF